LRPKIKSDMILLSSNSLGIITMFQFFKKKKKEPENLKDILAQFTEAHNSLCARFKDLEKDFEKVFKELADLREKQSFSIQKFGMVRFNPFQSIGGNQSFSVAFLDENDDGIVITSLYSNEGNRVYGKPIKNGQSEYLLSEEEKKAIEYAKRKKSKLNPEPQRAGYGAGNQTTGGGNFGPH